MQWKVVVSLLGFAALCGVTTNAQEPAPKFDVFAGYSYVRGVPSAGSLIGSVSLNGGDASAAYNFNNWLSGVADFGAYHTGSIRKQRCRWHAIHLSFRTACLLSPLPAHRAVR